MQAFHNDPKVKKKYLARVRAHAKADEIIKGQYWENGKGCAVGCTIHSSLHKNYETELGIPEWLARVEDTLFEGMELKHSKKWPERFLKAIKPGVDLEKVKAPFLVFVLQSCLDKFDHKKNPKVKESLYRVIALWSRDDIGTNSWEKERKAAANAAYAAYAANAAAADAANAAANAAAYAAAYAADADARKKSYKIFADKLIEIIESI